jgi:hypothetical protein
MFAERNASVSMKEQGYQQSGISDQEARIKITHSSQFGVEREAGRRGSQRRGDQEHSREGVCHSAMAVSSFWLAVSERRKRDGNAEFTLRRKRSGQAEKREQHRGTEKKKPRKRNPRAQSGVTVPQIRRAEEPKTQAHTPCLGYPGPGARGIRVCRGSFNRESGTEAPHSKVA